MTVKEVNNNESTMNGPLGISNYADNEPRRSESSIDNVSTNEAAIPTYKNSFSKRIMDSKIVKQVDTFFTTGRIWEVRKCCIMLVTNTAFRLVVIGLIFANAVLMGVGTYHVENPGAMVIIETIDLAFLIVFTVELMIQFTAYLLRLFLDGWLVFDFLIIVVGWIAQDSPVTVFRVFRIFRALRLITRVKTMKQLVSAIFSVLPSIAAILMLLFVIFYIFAVMFTQLYRRGESLEGEPYFENLFLSLFTLTQIMTFDGWGGVAHATISYDQTAGFLITIFLFITGFVVMNLIIAVICDAVSNAGDDVKEKIHGSFDEDDDGVGSEETMKLVRERMLGVEEQLDSLEQVQERNIHTLEYLASQLKQRKQRKQRKYVRPTLRPS